MSIKKRLTNTNQKAIWGWAIYDWANSAFATTIMAGFFPAFFKQFWNSGVETPISTARLGFGNAIASLIVAVLAPVLGALADRGNVRKSFLIVFAYTGAFSTGLLFFVPQQKWFMAISIYAVAVLGFSGANIFYDSLLPFVAPKDKAHFVSGLGYSLGYLGGGLLFLLNVLMVLKPHFFGIANSSMAIRLSFLSVALWWGSFTAVTLLWVPEPKGILSNAQPNSPESSISQGLKQVFSTLKKIRQTRDIMLFLIAYWLYIEGVDTIVRMAVDYGMSLGFKTTDLITALLITQFVGFPATLIYAKLGESIGPKKAILWAIAAYIIITLWGVFMTERKEFYVLAILIGLVQGGIQALSRSYYARLIPKKQASEYYGFYNMLGKFAAILGPALVGICVLLSKGLMTSGIPVLTQTTNVDKTAARIGISSIILLFIAGAMLLTRVSDKNE